ncbi:MAG TPA: hypothetical protein VE398_20455 [Acidobacteriota bacterium]|nr:hypothetical protein [Acidobacteriota bacterium]
MNYSISQTQERTQQIRIGGFLDAERRHKLYLFLGILIAAALAVALAVYGWNYYILDQIHRPLSAKHSDLKASGRIGLRLGELGAVFFALVYLYPLRKRWSFLARSGQTKHWLDFHILLALMGAVAISFHCAFKIHGFAGMAYWTMVALTVSGVVGRYFYAQIPRRIGDAEMSLKEMQGIGLRVVEELSGQKMLPARELERLFQMPDSREVQSMSMLKAIVQMMLFDIRHPFRVWTLRRRSISAGELVLTLGGILRTRHAALERAISLASGQSELAKRVLFLSKTHRVFHLWHVIHRPFSLTFAIFVIIHISVVISLGYF